MGNTANNFDEMHAFKYNEIYNLFQVNYLHYKFFKDHKPTTQMSQDEIDEFVDNYWKKPIKDFLVYSQHYFKHLSVTPWLTDCGEIEDGEILKKWCGKDDYYDTLSGIYVQCNIKNDKVISDLISKFFKDFNWENPYQDDEYWNDTDVYGVNPMMLYYYLASYAIIDELITMTLNARKKTYCVELCYHGSIQLDVVAESEEEALELARQTMSAMQDDEFIGETNLFESSHEVMFKN